MTESNNNKPKREKIVNDHFPIQIAGRLWDVGPVTMTKNSRGNYAIGLEDLISSQKDVANYICGEDSTLSYEEFEFLCALTSTKKTEVEGFLKLGKGTVTKWNRRPELSWPESVLLKKWFWQLLFGQADKRNQSSPGLELEKQKKYAIKLALSKPAAPIKVA